MPTESQLQDAALRAFIRQRLEDGLLPLTLSKTIAIGYGSGNKCLACDQPVTIEQIEYQAFGPRYGAALCLHWGCHVLWQLECVARIRKQRPGSREDTLGLPKDKSGGQDSDGSLERRFAHAF